MPAERRVGRGQDPTTMAGAGAGRGARSPGRGGDEGKERVEGRVSSQPLLPSSSPSYAAPRPSSRRIHARQPASIGTSSPAISLSLSLSLSILSYLPDQAVARLSVRDDGWRRASALRVGDDGGLPALHDAAGGVGGAQVDADDLKWREGRGEGVRGEGIGGCRRAVGREKTWLRVLLAPPQRA